MKTGVKKLSILLLTVIMSLFTVFGIIEMNCFVKTNAESVLFEKTYALNSSVAIPNRTITVNGKEVETTAVVIYPNGEAMSVSNVKLTQAGVYTVEYRATVNGKTVKETYTFTVDYPLFSTTNKRDIIEYGVVDYKNEEWAKPVEGLKVRLQNGSTFTNNTIIDLNKMGKNEPLFSFYIMPEVFGERDNGIFNFRVSEVGNPDNYFEVCMIVTVSRDDLSYLTASAHNQTERLGSAYAEAGDPGGGISGSYPYGYVAKGGFVGKGFGYEDYMISVWYDNVTQTVYATNSAYTSGTYLMCLSTGNFQNKWYGFENEKVNISAYGTSMDKSTCGIIFTYMAQTDLESTSLKVEASDIIVDFGDYTEDDYPSAVVGRPYKIFDARSLEMYTEEKLSVNVYTSYATSAQRNVNVVDGYFIPKTNATHTIEYVCTDTFGNTSKKTVKVKVKNDSDAIDFDLDQTAITIYNGENLILPQISNQKGGDGLLKLTTYIQKEDGERVEILGESVRLVGMGDYRLIYNVRDYNGASVEKEIMVNVQPAIKPMFTTAPVLPKNYIVGAKYKIPEIYAEDLTGDEIKKVKANVTLKTETGASINVEKGYFTVPDCKLVKVQFTAIDKNNQFAVETYSVTVVNTGFGSSLDVSKYFKVVGGSITAKDKYLALQPNGTYSKFEFIKELDGKNFTVDFKVTEGKGKFEEIRINLYDYNDLSKKIYVSLLNYDNILFVSVNGGDEYNTYSTFAGNLKIFSVNITGKTFNLYNIYASINKYADGSEFKGFSDFVYMDVEILGKTGDAEVQFMRLNQQVLNNMKYDVTSPNVFFSAGYGGEVEINQTATIYPVYAVDVLDPYSEMTFSMILPNGQYATAIDGTVLKNVPSDIAYTVKFEEYGRYRLNYAYSDSSGNEDNFSYVMSCADKIAPIITVEKTSITGKVGSEITVPKYKVEDNFSANVTVTVQVVDPTGYIITVTNGKFKPTKAGKYIIKYMAFDDENNLQFAEVVCTVS